MKTSILIASLIGFTTLVSFSAESLIQNGNFAKTLAPWKVISLKDAPATEKQISEGILTIKASGASDKPGTRQLSQEVAVKAGQNYALSFDVKGTLEGAKEMVVAIVPAPGKFASFKKVPIAADWATQKLRITPKEMELADGAQPMLKFMLGNLKGDVSFRNVSLVAAE